MIGDKLCVTFADDVPEAKIDKMIRDVEREIYYQGQGRKAMDQVWLWMKWIALPFLALVLLCALIYWVTGYNIANISLEGM